MYTPLDWNLVRSFVAVVDAGSLSRGARALGLAHPTVARHVQSLEENLGIPLFDRTGAGLALNEAGARLAEVGRRMQKDALAFDAVAESLRTTTEGVVRVTSSELMADLLPELLAPLVHGTDRQFEIIVSAEQLNLLEREADIALRHVRPEQSELVCRRIGDIAMGAFASRAYLARHGEPHQHNLADHWFIDGASEQPFTMAVERLGYHVPQQRVAWRTDSLRDQRRAAEAGVGIVALPLYLGDSHGDLQRVLVDAPPTTTAEALTTADKTVSIENAEVSVELWLVSRPGVRQQKLLSEVGDHLAGLLSERFERSVPNAA